jgi:DMSO reductase family type II enzyme heme b subunit
MRARYAGGAGLQELLAEGGVWSLAEAQPVALVPTPLGMQPTGAIRATWQGKNYGVVASVEVSAVHDGRHLAFRLHWRDPERDAGGAATDAFTDAAAVLLPAVANAPLATMGAAGAAVDAWYWRADEGDTGREVVAEGIGTSRTVHRGTVHARARWADGAWTVILARALRVDGPEPLAQMQPDDSRPIAFAIWEGRHGERAGIKSFSAQAVELTLDPMRQ